MKKNLMAVVREVERNLADLLDRKELGRYILNKEFDKIYKRINEVVDDLRIVVKILVGEV